MRRVLTILALAGLPACGDSSTGDASSRFPAVGGMYQVYGVLGSPPGSGQFSGPLALSRVSREYPALAGSASVNVTVAGKTERYTRVSFAQLEDYGGVQFYLDSPTSSNRIHFRGQVDGSVLRGSIDLTLANAVYFGTFTATR